MKKLTKYQEAYCQEISKVEGSVRLNNRIAAVIAVGYKVKTKQSQKAKVKELQNNTSVLNRISELRNSQGGCPTKYKPEYCEEIITFFNKPPYEPILITDDEGNETVATNKQGKPIMKPCALPTKEGFAFSIGVHSETLMNWAKKFTEFFEAIKKAENLQKNILIQNGLIGNYEKTFAIFVAKNVTDMKDKQIVEQHSKNLTYDISDKGDPKEAAAAYMELIKADEG